MSASSRDRFARELHRLTEIFDTLTATGGESDETAALADNISGLLASYEAANTKVNRLDESLLIDQMDHLDASSSSTVPYCQSPLARPRCSPDAVTGVAAPSADAARPPAGRGPGARGLPTNVPENLWRSEQNDEPLDRDTLGAMVAGRRGTSSACVSSSDFLAEHLLKKDLFVKATEPFDGSPSRFASWRLLLENRMADVPSLSALDKICILEAHTCGPALEVVRNLANMAGVDPQGALQRIWSTLRSRYGNNYVVAEAIRDRLGSFPVMSGYNCGHQLRDFADLLLMVQSHIAVIPALSDLDQPSALTPLRLKLPDFIQNRWRKVGTEYEDSHDQRHPPFSVFCDFVSRTAHELCNSNYSVPQVSERARTPADCPRVGSSARAPARALRSTVSPDRDLLSSEATVAHRPVTCAIHRSNNHKFIKCPIFLALSAADRRDAASFHRLCFSCFHPGHAVANCRSVFRCSHCGSTRHNSLLHPQQDCASSDVGRASVKKTDYQRDDSNATSLQASTASSANPLSCSKTVLVEISSPRTTDRVFRCYAIIDDQSNKSFISTRAVSALNAERVPTEYTLSTLDRTAARKSGHLCSGIFVSNIGSGESFALPPLLSSEELPDTTDEAATPAIVRSVPKLRHLAFNFHERDPAASVCVLIGRDSGDLMRSYCHGQSEPFAHDTPLGWCLVGGSCLKDSTSAASAFRSCSHIVGAEPAPPSRPPFNLNGSVFEKTKGDDLTTNSRDDDLFLSIMNNGTELSATGHLVLPLPTKEPVNMPDNRNPTFKRTLNSLRNLKRAGGQRLDQSVAFMQKIIDAGHVQQLAVDFRSPPQGKGWWLPIFPVHQVKKNKTRLVFDSAAKFDGVCLNDVLLTGPDSTNRLTSVLTLFRDGAFAVAADIEAMFHCFQVPERQRDLLRFFWWAGNDPGRPIVQYRATVHLFGNCSSPAVATYGLRRAAELSNDAEVIEFVRRRFYVDDGLLARSTVEDVSRLIRSTMAALACFKIRLHKIVSNSSAVLQQFAEEDLAPVAHDTYDLEPGFADAATNQPILGVRWNTRDDSFTLSVDTSTAIFTKRGLLSAINGIFDPLGMASPCVLRGKLLLREIMSTVDEPSWDSVLPDDVLPKWKDWLSSIESLRDLSIPRSISVPPHKRLYSTSLHGFCDASAAAIGFVVYRRILTAEGDVFIRFVCAASKVAPKAAGTIPRLELCAALELARAVDSLVGLLQPDKVTLYSDSAIVLGYISNSSKRFSVYVTNRVNDLLNLTTARQWSYVPTANNPADLATRPADPPHLNSSVWVSGPSFLRTEPVVIFHLENYTPLPEMIADTVTLLSGSARCADSVALFGGLYLRLSRWSRIVGAAAAFVKAIRTWCRRCHVDLRLLPSVSPAALLIRDAQRACGVTLSTTAIRSLAPFLDESGSVRVGGRLKHADIAFEAKHPFVIPREHPVAAIIVQHFHVLCHHQGRHITGAAVRQAGFIVVNASRTVRRVIAQCVTCKRLRGLPSPQLMADLPPDRLEESPPFTNVGIDVFGPFATRSCITTRRLSDAKTWVLLVNCLVSRAIHCEILSSMDTSTFLLALRRFLSIRGNCKLIRCDNGSNFVGAANLDKSFGTIDHNAICDELTRRSVTWLMNPPLSSHFGGVWERKIGSLRRVLDFTLSRLNGHLLKYDEFETLIREASAVVNNTPLWAVDDNDDVVPLSPAVLLTLRSDPNPPPAAVFCEKDILAYGPRRWRRVQALADLFWRRWRESYLTGLQYRSKWQQPRRDLEVKDVVLLREKTAARNSWPTARVVAVRHSEDGHVRSATIRMSVDGSMREFVRPTSDMVLLLPASVSGAVAVGANPTAGGCVVRYTQSTPEQVLVMD